MTYAERSATTKIRNGLGLLACDEQDVAKA
jgi:hypothetical protein